MVAEGLKKYHKRLFLLAFEANRRIRAECVFFTKTSVFRFYLTHSTSHEILKWHPHTWLVCLYSPDEKWLSGGLTATSLEFSLAFRKLALTV